MKKNSKSTIFNLTDSERETLHSALSIFHELVERVYNEEKAKKKESERRLRFCYS